MSLTAANIELIKKIVNRLRFTPEAHFHPTKPFQIIRYRLPDDLGSVTKESKPIKKIILLIDTSKKLNPLADEASVSILSRPMLKRINNASKQLLNVEKIEAPSFGLG